MLIFISFELALILGVMLAIWIPTFWRPISKTEPKVHDPKRGHILCEICGEILPFNAKRTKDGHWACPLHRVTVFHDDIVASDR